MCDVSPSGSSTVLARRRERVRRFSCTLKCSIARSIIWDEQHRNQLIELVFTLSLSLWKANAATPRSLPSAVGWFAVHDSFHSTISLHRSMIHFGTIFPHGVFLPVFIAMHYGKCSLARDRHACRVDVRGQWRHSINQSLSDSLIYSFFI